MMGGWMDKNTFSQDIKLTLIEQTKTIKLSSTTSGFTWYHIRVEISALVGKRDSAALVPDELHHHT